LGVEKKGEKVQVNFIDGGRKRRTPRARAADLASQRRRRKPEKEASG